MVVVGAGDGAGAVAAVSDSNVAIGFEFGVWAGVRVGAGVRAVETGAEIGVRVDAGASTGVFELRTEGLTATGWTLN